MIKVKEDNLKYIAAFAMLCDHFAHSVPDWAYYEFPAIIFHCIGSTAAPIFFYMLASGYRRTRNVKKYATRLFIFACVSYLPFIMFFTGSLPDTPRDFFRLNVIFLMFFSLILLKILHEEKNIFVKVWGIFVCVLFISLCDWGILGLAYILIFDYFRNDKKAMLFAGIVLTIVNMSSNFFGMFEPAYDYFRLGLLEDINTWNPLFYAMFTIVPFLLIYAVKSETSNQIRGKRNGFEKWFFYIFYPAHFLLLYYS
jgi:hypothetical protein